MNKPSSVPVNVGFAVALQYPGGRSHRSDGPAMGTALRPADGMDARDPERAAICSKIDSEEGLVHAPLQSISEGEYHA